MRYIVVWHWNNGSFPWLIIDTMGFVSVSRHITQTEADAACRDMNNELDDSETVQLRLQGRREREQVEARDATRRDQRAAARQERDLADELLRASRPIIARYTE